MSSSFDSRTVFPPALLQPMWKSLKRLTLAPPVGTTTRPLVAAVKERGAALEQLLLPQSDVLAGMWTSAVATGVPPPPPTVPHRINLSAHTWPVLPLACYPRKYPRKTVIMTHLQDFAVHFSGSCQLCAPSSYQTLLAS